VRLTDLDRERAFALLGPGFSERGGHVLVTDLRSAAAAGTVVFAPYESDAAGAVKLDGTVTHLDAVDIDVAPASLAVDLTSAGYEQAVARIRAAIAAGDVYEVNLTLRAQLAPIGAPALAASLCRRGVPRFFAWVRLPDGRELVSASPELLFAIDGGTVRAEPMKGTASPEREAELAESAKERAELAMITDLVRNDLTPVCVPRSVRVVSERRFLRLPYAVQAVSDVEGELLPGVGPTEVLRALHPGGSVTGAPKHAAMKLIAALEPTPRGAYCGALGLCSEGHARFSLLIRTAFRSATGWTYGVGGAIVWDSDAARELEEIHLKLGALR
jgi:anthranilate/para-aminobenzoate synthase component I